jgi:alkanesulfonate monooxygenase SsuD/methylene tetrahydromethanopterin reductase-like flavin-dependent oxidoreductase (luciferase family)
MPHSVQRPRPPLILGGTTVGPRMQALVGRYADEFNTVGGTAEEVGARFTRARAGVEAAGRDPQALVTSLMTWFFVAPTEDAYLEKLRRAHSLDPSAGPFDAYRADIEHDCIVGTPDRAIARLHEYANVGVQRIFLNHELYDDLEMLDLMATDVMPAVP